MSEKQQAGGTCRLNFTTSFQWFILALIVLHLIQSHVMLDVKISNDSSTKIETRSSREEEDRHSNISYSILDIPKGKAIALPSIRIEEEEEAITRKRHGNHYGGKGDKAHLGGFTEYDPFGVSPAVWKFMIRYLGVKSLLDVGCGRGISTSWFLLHGVDAYCVEGSHDAVMQSMIPDVDKRVTEHDFSRGPWWPSTTVDAVWCVEFLEHVGRNFHKNYLPAMRKAALIFATSSNWGGWHHVEVHDTDWWVLKFEMYGFRYSQYLTDQVRGLAKTESGKGPDGEDINAQHVWLNMKVFINPAVAALPQHAHLLAEHGCYGGRQNNRIMHRECDTGSNAGREESKLPKSFYPIQITPEMDQAWIELVQKHIKPISKR